MILILALCDLHSTKIFNPNQVHETQRLETLHPIYDLVNIWSWIWIFRACLVELSEIYTHTHTHHFHEFFFTITMLASHVGYFISWMYLAYSKFFTFSATTNLFSSPPFASSRRRASLRVLWVTNDTPHLDLFETYLWVPR